MNPVSLENQALTIMLGWVQPVYVGFLKKFEVSRGGLLLLLLARNADGRWEVELLSYTLKWKCEE